MQFEVEIRCPFDSPEEAYDTIPFLRSSLSRECSWESTLFGLHMFKDGQLLRRGIIRTDGETRYYLGWKGPDIGKVANIRQELEEDITEGIKESAILSRLDGKKSYDTYREVIREIEELGYTPFLSFTGKDVSGYYEHLGLHLKLMKCPELKWPLIVEIEKLANTEEEAIQLEQELIELSQQLDLRDRLIREEPPTLLYNAKLRE